MKIIRIVEPQTGLYVGSETDLMQGKLVLHMDKHKVNCWGYEDTETVFRAPEKIAEGLSEAFGLTFLALERP